MENKPRNIWQNLGLALVGVPIVSLVGLVLITLIGALDDAITKFQLAGYWWIILIVSYLLSLAYFLYEPSFRKNKERDKVVNSLLFYLKDQLQKQQDPYPTIEDEMVRETLLERFKIWAWQDPKLWKKYFPNEKYSNSLFGIVDSLIAVYKKTKNSKKHNYSWKMYMAETKLKFVQGAYGKQT